MLLLLLPGAIPFIRGCAVTEAAAAAADAAKCVSTRDQLCETIR